MSQFIGGKPLDEDVKRVTDIEGERFTFQIEKVGDKETVKKASRAIMFAGERLAGGVTLIDGKPKFTIYGDAKVHCNDSK